MPCDPTTTGLLGDCCGEIQYASRKTSIGKSSIVLWKNDYTGLPVELRPFCTLFSTLTITLTNIGGAVVCRVVIRSKFEDGVNDGDAQRPQTYVESIEGGQPCAAFSQSGVSARFENGYNRFYLCSGVQAGTISYRISNPVVLSDAENVAALLSSLVDYETIAHNSGQLVRYSLGSILTEQSNQQFCTNSSPVNGFPGFLTAAGRYAHAFHIQALQPVEFDSGGSLSWLSSGVTGWGAGGLLPTVKMRAYVWRSKIEVQGPWCRYNGSFQYLSPQQCNLTAGIQPNCILGQIESRTETDSQFIELPPSTPSSYTIIGFGPGSCP